MDPILTDNIIKLGMAVLVGGLIGAEREYQDKAAGFRTIILITLGSALFTIFSLSIDPGFTQTRIAANIVTGIGFLGAGAIIREHGKIGGLTTAATIWLSAALGMGIGAGALEFVLVSTGVVLIVLFIFPLVERRIDRIREARTYKVVIESGNAKGIETIQQALEACSLNAIESHQRKTESAITSTLLVVGSPKNQKKFVEMLMKDKSVKEFDY
ncbi:MAG TPA: MgtC/SapB family protein [Anaerolineales bacterium]|jgi:putative Mg2+ transporter-C (MgtC) family protein|nr:MgtC/SapB family protein [Anaerolineales bacterium]